MEEACLKRAMTRFSISTATWPGWSDDLVEVVLSRPDAARRTL